MGGFTYGGIDVGRPGISAGGVLGRANGGAARAATAAPATSGGGDAGTAHPGGMPVVTVLLGFAGIILAMHLLRRQSSHLQATTFGFSWYAAIMIALVVIVGVNVLKIVANKVNLGPVTTVINAV